MVEATGASRLRTLAREDLVRAVLIVDAGRVRGVTYEALASYLAMAALAQLDPEASPGELDTIMSLFDGEGPSPGAPGTLTQWDRAYLRGLYASPNDTRNLHAQRGAIRRSMRTAADQ